MFETFTRLEGSDRKGGTGLGLAIVKGFAEAMGLTVAAANRGDPRGRLLPDPLSEQPPGQAERRPHETRAQRS